MRRMGWMQRGRSTEVLRRLALAALAALVLDPPAVAQQGSEPNDRGTREVAKVRLGTPDVLVTHCKGRTVPGLTAGDFNLIVDGKATPVDTVDEYCPSGAMEEPRGGKTTTWSEPADAPE